MSVSCEQPSERFNRPVPSRSPRVSFTLTGRDIEILQVISEHRFLRREQVSLLVRRHAKRIHRRLFKLERHAFLTSLRFPQQKYIYGLRPAGILALVEQGITPPHRPNHRLRTRELSELFLKHEMMIIDVHVAIQLACQAGSPLRLAAWREGRGLFDSVLVVSHRGAVRMPVRADAFFTLQDTRRPESHNDLNFFLEADRSTTSHARFGEKIRAYWAYVEQGLHRTRISVEGIRILTITLTDARAKNLTALADSLLPERARKYFLFAPIDRFSSRSLLEPACYSPRVRGGDQLYPLVPDSNGLQNE